MDPYGKQWGAPFPYFQQSGPYLAQQAPPASGPFDGTLVALPCVNPDWLRIMLGALDTLRNPSNWAPVTELSLSTVLQQVDELKGQLSIAGECVNPLVALHLEGCKLVAVPATGPAIDVLDFSSDTCGCTNQCIIPPVPPNPGGNPNEQRACNIAGFIATKIIQLACEQVISYAQTESQVSAYSVQVMSIIGWLFPYTYAATIAFNDFFQVYIGGVIANYEAAAADDTLWSRVTCAIFGAIKADGYITEANFPAVISAVCAVSYPHADVVGSICQFISHIGIENMLQAQNAGATDDVDCSACSLTWCKYWDLTVASSWYPNPVEPSQTPYVPGTGFVGYDDGSGNTGLAIRLDAPTPINITEMQALVVRAHPNSTGSPSNCNIQEPVGTVVGYNITAFDGVSFPGETWMSGTLSGSAQHAFFFLVMSGTDSGNLQIKAVQLRGTGVCPFTLCDNCVVGP